MKKIISLLFVLIFFFLMKNENLAIAQSGLYKPEIITQDSVFQGGIFLIKNVCPNDTVYVFNELFTGNDEYLIGIPRSRVGRVDVQICYNDSLVLQYSCRINKLNAGVRQYEKIKLNPKDTVDISRFRLDSVFSLDDYFPNKIIDTIGNPLKYMLEVSPYGRIRMYGNIYTFHRGIDFRANERTPIYSIADGKVLGMFYSPRFGNTLVVSHGHKNYSVYMHMSEFLICASDTIKVGNLIGYTGHTGRDLTGKKVPSHLHLAYVAHKDAISYKQVKMLINKMPRE